MWRTVRARRTRAEHACADCIRYVRAIVWPPDVTNIPRAEIATNLDRVSGHVLSLVGDRSRVVLIGASSGVLTRQLLDRGCSVSVVGDERDVAAARAAGAFIAAGSVEHADWNAVLGAGTFDVVAIDGLERLREPAQMLAALRASMNETSVVVAAIPNAGHLSVLAELMLGRFVYQPLGVVDARQLRLFTRDSIEACFDDAGLEIVSLERVIVRPDRARLQTEGRLEPEVIAALERREEATTASFLITAKGLTGEHSTVAGRTPSRALFEDRADDRASIDVSGTAPLDGFLQAVAARWAFFENEREQHRAQIGELRAALGVAEKLAADTRVELQRAEARVEALAGAAEPTRELQELRHTHGLQQREWRLAHAAVSRRIIDERLRFGAELEAAEQRRFLLTPDVTAGLPGSSALARFKRSPIAAPLRWGRRMLRRVGV